ncbi:glycosyltransferase family 2 protein [Fictibacillus fluitans]|uniref:Glycosyltransferase n=1 Tax=Fictibacillus fluitans TaxID=3058422 RepID=A0ABT8I141_9BACL|nr:glycosyltransferase [Fictibacillus sp. NE201]MDN4526716.1 glycosyltransferase [Fictibacillus sp. NE201]
MPEISVIVPIFNAEKYLSKCIKSILNQTFRDFELILVNDGSTDNSLKICRNFSEKDNRIFLINQANKGSIEARRAGLNVSNSKLIMFVDADDWVNARILELLHNELVINDVDITVCNMSKVLGNGYLVKKVGDNTYFKGSKIYDKEKIMNSIVVAYFHGHPFPSSLSAKLYKKELLMNSGKYLDRIKFLGDDLFYNIEILTKTNRIKVIDKSLYNYRAGGFTSKYMPALFDDMVNGYLIQKEIIENLYHHTLEKQMNGISIMLLNTLKTCLSNLFYSDFDITQRKSIISNYVSNMAVRESIRNSGAKNYFSDEYLMAIQEGDINYLYNLGLDSFNKNKLKRFMIHLVAKTPMI